MSPYEGNTVYVLRTVGNDQNKFWHKKTREILDAKVSTQLPAGPAKINNGEKETLSPRVLMEKNLNSCLSYLLWGIYYLERLKMFQCKACLPS